MVTEIRAPKILNSSVTPSVGRWFKRIGDPVTFDEPLVEIDTDNLIHEVGARVPSAIKAEATPESALPKSREYCTERFRTYENARHDEY